MITLRHEYPEPENIDQWKMKIRIDPNPTNWDK